MSDFVDGPNPSQQHQQYQPKPPKKPGVFKRHPILAFCAAIVIVGTLGLVGCVAVVGTAVDDAADQAQGENVPASSVPATSTAPKASGKSSAKPTKEAEDYSYTGLKVTKDTSMLETFKGVVTIKNNTNEPHDYFIEVTIFKGQQDVGTLNGTLKVKAHGSGVAKLTSLDDYVSGATDYQVAITPGLS
jgi:hypothetical protein